MITGDAVCTQTILTKTRPGGLGDLEDNRAREDNGASESSREPQEEWRPRSVLSRPHPPDSLRCADKFIEGILGVITFQNSTNPAPDPSPSPLHLLSSLAANATTDWSSAEGER